MGDVLTFGALPRRSAPPPPAPADTRRLIEEAAQTALDTADRLLAILDRLDGDPDCEDGGDTEPDLGAPDGHASQLVWLRGGDRDLELTSPEQR